MREDKTIDSSRFKTWVYTLRDDYYKVLDTVWKKIPNFLGTIIATVIIFIAGSTMRGDWLLILVHFIRSFRQDSNSTDIDNRTLNISDFSLVQFRLEGLPFFLIMNLTVSYTLFFGVCGFLQWYFYIRRRGEPETWKCQPTKFLDPELERHEILAGSINVGIGALVFGTLACYINNGGYTSLYFKPDQYGWLWLAVQAFPLFIYQDAASYYGHRLFHVPFLYRRFHKWHHYYKQPTAFSATSFHPFEFLVYQSFLIMPAIFVPLNVVIYVVNLLYIYYYGLIDHSGIKMKGFWPWQPDTTFHDNHHEYFNINFGFNLEFWDKFHGTYKYIDNSLVGNNKPVKNKFRSYEETLRLEAELIEGKKRKTKKH